MPIKDYYKILGVSKDTKDEDIKKKYRELAKKYHPDANPGDKQAEEKFKEANEAYEVLSNREKRQKYDRLKSAQDSGYDFSSFKQGGAPRGYPGGEEFDLRSIFEDLFGEKEGRKSSSGFEDVFDMFFQGTGRNTAHRRAARQTTEKGEDITARVEIPFALAMNGGSTIIKVPRANDCVRCRGTGAEPGAKSIVCPMCSGKGVMEFMQGGFAVQKTCPQCGGKGQQPVQKCRECNGSGEVTETRQVRINIPPGVKDNDRIRIKEQGNMNSWNKKRGDLYVLFKVKPSDMYERKGDDLYYNARINIAQALLGAKIPVPTPDGDVIIKVPPGARENMVLKIKARGAQNIRTKKRGDFMARVKIDMNPPLNDKERKIIEEYARVKNLKL